MSRKLTYWPQLKTIHVFKHPTCTVAMHCLRYILKPVSLGHHFAVYVYRVSLSIERGFYRAVTSNMLFVLLANVTSSKAPAPFNHLLQRTKSIHVSLLFIKWNLVRSYFVCFSGQINFSFIRDVYKKEERYIVEIYTRLILVNIQYHLT